ncbi:hypothetical protein GMOD_00003829 [Pyrenophora seminiperda CCB06]|uniref:Uncharacterized protein n=1 Tax=Pyrenophora seminiperda CCB06 TaxID=1302712 RepID=A0A3M7M009_9PLEO|nr:hypothetical protein GMOD_00003829 [Pyrenophora seminiperda CCB06]
MRRWSYGLPRARAGLLSKRGVEMSGESLLGSQSVSQWATTVKMADSGTHTCKWWCRRAEGACYAGLGE